jgi:hypothetical protein
MAASVLEMHCLRCPRCRLNLAGWSLCPQANELVLLSLLRPAPRKG